MPPIFSTQKREELKESLLQIGIELIRENGIRKMSIDKVTKRAGLGKGTFYHFFTSKEDFVFETIAYSREKLYRAFEEQQDENGMLDRAGVWRLMQQFSFVGENNIISSMSYEDEQWLIEHTRGGAAPDEQRETKVMQYFFSHVRGLRADFNHQVAANMMKTMAFMVECREQLYQEELPATLEVMGRSLCDYIFEGGENNEDLQ